MLPNSPCFVFYLDNIETSGITTEHLDSLISKYSFENIYFFTHKCNTSIKSLFKELTNNNISCSSKNIMTPTYLLINYCKTLLGDFSVYPITDTNDLWDFHMQNIKIDYDNPNVFFICTNKISKKDLNLIYNTNIPIAISSNLCYNRLLKCSGCFKNCFIKDLTMNLKSRIILPDSPPIYNSSILFKYLNIQPKHTVLITNSLRDDYIQYKRHGCKVILLLKDKSTLKNYFNSPHDVDIVLDNFDNLLYLLKLK